MSSLSFDAPHRLWLLLIPVAMVVAYLFVQRRRRSYAVRFTNVDLLDSVAPECPGGAGTCLRFCCWSLS